MLLLIFSFLVDQLLALGINVTVYNGQLDMICDTVGELPTHSTLIFTKSAHINSHIIHLAYTHMHTHIYTYSRTVHNEYAHMCTHTNIRVHTLTHIPTLAFCSSSLYLYLSQRHPSMDVQVAVASFERLHGS